MRPEHMYDAHSYRGYKLHSSEREDGFLRISITWLDDSLHFGC